MTAAEHGRLAVGADSPLLPGLGAAFAEGGWCISAGAPPRQMTRLVLQLCVRVQQKIIQNSANFLPV